MNNSPKKKTQPKAVHPQVDEVAVLTEALQRERADSQNLSRRHEQEMQSLEITLRLM